jgi:sodium-dependent phosphate cotransporter
MDSGEPKTVPPPRPQSETQPSPRAWLSGVLVIAYLLIFLVGIRGLGQGFQGLGEDLLDKFFHATDNPFAGLVIGILGTTLVQSSSVTTSMVVAMVAAPEHALPIQNAVPIIMGANIGTTVTNSVVALGHMSRPDEFRRAFSTATCHDFFNFMAVGTLLPLELTTGVLTRTSASLTQFLGAGGGGAKLPNPIKTAAKAGLAPIQSAIDAIGLSSKVSAVVLILVSAVIIFTALLLIVRTLRQLAAGRLQTYIARSLDSSAWVGLLVGVVVTIMVQSSSITTSVLVPLAGAGIINLRQAFPITLGANIGTTFTSLVASTAGAAETAHLGLQIALVHLLFNLLGTALIYPLPFTRNIPLRLAEWLADVAVRSRKAALAYVFGMFYGLPALLVFISRYF